MMYTIWPFDMSILYFYSRVYPWSTVCFSILIIHWVSDAGTLRLETDKNKFS